MKLIMFTSDFPPSRGGISTLSKDLALAISPMVKDFEVHVLLRKNLIEISDQDFDFKIFRSGSFTLFKNLIYVWKIIFQNRKTPTIYQSQNLFPVGLFVVLGRLIFGGKVINHVYGTDFLSTLARKSVKLLKKLTLKFSDAIIFISQSTKREVLKEINLKNKNTAIIYCPMPEPKIISAEERFLARRHFHLKETDFILLSVSNLVRRKGVHFIVEAMNKLPNNVKLFIIGGGPEKEILEKQIFENNLSDRVFLFGRVAETKLYYEATDLFVMASYYDKTEGDIEGLGIVILEAESFGLPVLVARSGGMPEAMKENETGLVFEEGDVADLTSKILRIMSDRALRDKFQKNAPEFVAENFNQKSISAKYLEIYQKLLNEKKH